IRDFHVTGVQTCALPISSIEKTTTYFLPSFSLIGQESFLTALLFTSLRVRRIFITMSSTSSGPSLLHGGSGKNKPRVPLPPSDSSLLTGSEAFEAYTRSMEAT